MISLSLSIFIYTYISLSIYLSLSLYLSLSIYIYVYVYVYVCVYIYIYSYALRPRRARRERAHREGRPLRQGSAPAKLVLRPTQKCIRLCPMHLILKLLVRGPDPHYLVLKLLTSKDIGRPGNRLFCCKEFLCFNTMPCPSYALTCVL